MKRKTPKAGYYVEPNDGFVYLYIKEENRWIFLSSDSTDEPTGTPEYDTEDIVNGWAEYVGPHLNDLIRHTLNSKLKK